MSEAETRALREVGERLAAIEAQLALLVRALMGDTSAPPVVEECGVCRGRAKNCPVCKGSR